MRIRHEMSYDAPAAEVFAMLADPAFREKVCDAMDAIEKDVKISGGGDGSDGMDVVVDQTQPATGIPSFATKFVGDEIRIIQSEDWDSAGGAALSVEIPGKPGHLKGSISLVATGSGTTEVVEGDIKVNIPLVGGKLEKLIGDLLVKALKTENRVGKTWLAGER